MSKTSARLFKSLYVNKSDDLDCILFYKLHNIKNMERRELVLEIKKFTRKKPFFTIWLIAVNSHLCCLLMEVLKINQNQKYNQELDTKKTISLWVPLNRSKPSVVNCTLIEKKSNGRITLIAEIQVFNRFRFCFNLYPLQNRLAVSYSCHRYIYHLSLFHAVK